MIIYCKFTVVLKKSVGKIYDYVRAGKIEQIKNNIRLGLEHINHCRLLNAKSCLCVYIKDPIYPTPPLGQDMTQGQFLSEV